MTFKYRKCSPNIPIMHISIIFLQSLFLQIQFPDLSQFANDMLNPIFDSRFFQFNSRYALYQTRAGSQARSTLLKEIYQTHILHKIYQIQYSSFSSCLSCHTVDDKFLALFHARLGPTYWIFS